MFSIRLLGHFRRNHTVAVFVNGLCFYTLTRTLPARVSGVVERLTSVHDRKHPTGLEFRAVLTEGSTEIFELSKA
jgi:hypothetical protein